jgi:hypothetical protein
MRIPDLHGHDVGSGLGMVTQTVRATASTPPWASSSTDPASCLRPAAGPRARRPGSTLRRREGASAPGRPCDRAPSRCRRRRPRTRRGSPAPPRPPRARPARPDRRPRVGGPRRRPQVAAGQRPGEDPQPVAGGAVGPTGEAGREGIALEQRVACGRRRIARRSSRRHSRRWRRRVARRTAPRGAARPPGRRPPLPLPSCGRCSGGRTRLVSRARAAASRARPSTTMSESPVPLISSRLRSESSPR